MSKLTNAEAVEKLDELVDKLTEKVIDGCNPDNWPKVVCDDPGNPDEHERLSQLQINAACAKAAGNIAKLLSSVSSTAENRRRQMTLNNANKPHREGEISTAALIAEAEKKANMAAKVIEGTRAAPPRKVH